jgi:RNA polymerase sigma-70 factor, ECF subfamily
MTMCTAEFVPVESVPARSARSSSPRHSTPRSAGADAFIRDLSTGHRAAVTAYASRITGDRGLAEDIVQETLVRAWENVDKFDQGKGSARGWLFRVAHNIAIDKLRARQAHPVEVGEANTASIATVRDHAEDVTTTMIVRDALNRLSPDHRAALYECYYCGHSVAEAAAVLGIPAGTVKSRMYYALRNLREVLQRQAVVG